MREAEEEVAVPVILGVRASGPLVGYFSDNLPRSDLGAFIVVLAHLAQESGRGVDLHQRRQVSIGELEKVLGWHYFGSRLTRRGAPGNLFFFDLQAEHGEVALGTAGSVLLYVPENSLQHHRQRGVDTEMLQHSLGPVRLHLRVERFAHAIGEEHDPVAGSQLDTCFLERRVLGEANRGTGELQERWRRTDAKTRRPGMARGSTGQSTYGWLEHRAYDRELLARYRVHRQVAVQLGKQVGGAELRGAAPQHRDQPHQGVREHGGSQSVTGNVEQVQGETAGRQLCVAERITPTSALGSHTHDQVIPGVSGTRCGNRDCWIA